MGAIGVGARVYVEDGSRGTVRYVGPVEGQTGEWAGIDWDDPTRGRHDGSLNGKRYFDTSNPKSGSFVRISKLHPGFDLLHEIQERYGGTGAEESQEVVGDRVVELVNLEKTARVQRRIYSLKVVVLDDWHVTSPPPPGTPSFAFCTELNLHNNLLTRWIDVLDIIAFFPRLERNRMASISSLAEVGNRRVSAPVFHLVLTECRLTESSIRVVLELFPTLRELYVARNGLASFDPGETGERLTHIDLTGNPIGSFHQLKGLAKLKNLTRLSLTECGIEQVRFHEGDGEQDTVGFEALEVLNLKDNRITDWESVNALSQLKRLKVLYMDIRLLPSTPHLDNREVVIAKLPTIIDLERCDISAVERRSSEIRFVNHCGVDPVLKEHEEDVRRLVKKHGPPAVSTSKKGIGLIRLRLEDAEGKSFERAFPVTMSVQKLIEVAARHFALDAKATIICQLGENGYRMPLDNPLRALSFYSLEEGESLRVEKE